MHSSANCLASRIALDRIYVAILKQNSINPFQCEKGLLKQTILQTIIFVVEALLVDGRNEEKTA